LKGERGEYWPDLFAWIGHVSKWDLNHRQGLDFPIQSPEPAIKPSEYAAAIGVALLRRASLAAAGRVVAIGTRPRGPALRADHGDRHPVVVGDAGDDKLAPIAERAGAKVSSIHAPRIANGRQQAHLSQATGSAMHWGRMLTCRLPGDFRPLE
jgi:hypothetical protein